MDALEYHLDKATKLGDMSHKVAHTELVAFLNDIFLQPTWADYLEECGAKSISRVTKDVFDKGWETY